MSKDSFRYTNTCISFVKTVSKPPEFTSIWKYYTFMESMTENSFFCNAKIEASQDQQYQASKNLGTKNITNIDIDEQDIEVDTSFEIRTSDVDEDSEKQSKWLTLEMHSGRNPGKSKRQELPAGDTDLTNSILKESNFFNDIQLNCILEKYLDILDKWQQEVYEIRIAHHDIWKNSRVSKIIKQHRAGSRVESQTRILPPGKDTDVDYMFELSGILINCDENRRNIYWTSSSSLAFGSVFVVADFLEELKLEYRDILTTESFALDVQENAFILLPNRFKENVVKASQFEFKEYSKTSTTSPSIAGKGAIKEYDTVPCLKLLKWPKVTNSWILRGPHGNEFAFNLKWKETIFETIPIFLVPTGNPTSENKHKQFRLSFSMAEIRCFSQITAKMRKNYGIAKYVFKSLFCSTTCDLLSSYHIKTIFLWQCEQLSIEQWENITPFTYIKLLFSEIKSCILKQNIQHYFISECNIFPLHKMSHDNLRVYCDMFENEKERIFTTIMMLLRSDLVLKNADNESILALAKSKLGEMAEPERTERYVSGYLTRLLSMITFSLIENDKTGKLMECIENVRHTFEFYKSSTHLPKIINIINIVIVRLQASNAVIFKLIPCCSGSRNSVSETAHVAFELYLLKRYDEVESLISRALMGTFRPSEIGVSVTKYHKNYDLDAPINFVIDELEKRMGFCPRFYIDPYLMIYHLNIQVVLIGQHGQSDTKSISSATRFSLQEQYKSLASAALKLSEREPYIGKLSYKFAAVFLLHGYRKLFNNLDIKANLEIPDIDSFNQRMFATNFDLR